MIEVPLEELQLSQEACRRWAKHLVTACEHRNFPGELSLRLETRARVTPGGELTLCARLEEEEISLRIAPEEWRPVIAPSETRGAA